MKIKFFNAFWFPQTVVFRIKDNGYLAPSRLYNVDVYTNKTTEKIYINKGRNVFKDGEYKNLVHKIIAGHDINTK